MTNSHAKRRDGISLFRRPGKPFRGFGFVFHNSLARRVRDGEVVLRRGVSLFRRREEPLGGFSVIMFEPNEFHRMAPAVCELRLRVPLLRRLAKPLGGFVLVFIKFARDCRPARHVEKQSQPVLRFRVPRLRDPHERLGRAGVMFRRGFGIPFRGFRQILCHALTPFITSAQVELRTAPRKMAFGGNAEAPHRLGRILRHAVPLQITQAD